MYQFTTGVGYVLSYSIYIYTDLFHAEDEPIHIKGFFFKFLICLLKYTHLHCMNDLYNTYK